MINLVSELQNSNLNLEMIRQETIKDEMLMLMNDYLRKGWPTRLFEKKIQTYFELRDSLNVENGCLTVNDRVVIPKSLRNQALQLLYLNHKGDDKMKRVAREVMFWEGINTDIDKFYLRRCMDRGQKLINPWSEFI